jgi:putative transposase
MDVSMMKRLKELEEENRRLKKMYTEERLKAESSRRLLMKRGAIPQRSEEKQSGEAIFEKEDGPTCRRRERHFVSVSLVSGTK